MSAFPQSEMRTSKDTPSATPLPLVAQFKVPRSHAHEYTITSFAATGPDVNRSCSFQPAAALNVLDTKGISSREVKLHAEKVRTCIHAFSETWIKHRHGTESTLIRVPSYSYSMAIATFWGSIEPYSRPLWSPLLAFCNVHTTHMCMPCVLAIIIINAWRGAPGEGT
jgi:hypothetical protein